MLDELWNELGQSMRRIRLSNGLSLRQLEARSSWTRGTLSQVENAKARPSRSLVAWYDDVLHADGLLLSIYTTASGRNPDLDPIPDASEVEFSAGGDKMSLIEAGLPAGLWVQPDSTHEAWWRIENAGSVPWRRRGLRRVGAYAGVRVISSELVSGLDDLEPGETTTLRCAVRAPVVRGTVIAYWRMVDESNRYCFPTSAAVTLLLIVA